MKKILLFTIASLLVPMANAAAADVDLPPSWSGFYAGLHAGYGAGKSDMVIPGAGNTLSSVCRTNSFGDIPLIAPPSGSVFDSAIAYESYSPAVASILGLTETSPGSTIYTPTTQTAFDFRNYPGGMVADDECIFHTAYALYDNNYYGGRQASGPAFGPLPADFSPSDSAGTIITTVTPGAGDENVTADLSGLLGGIQVGWNHMAGNNIVFGFEADLALSSVGGDDDIGAGKAETDINWLSSFRGRLGVAKDRWLIYATGGPAIAGTKLTYDDGMNSETDFGTAFGWTAGGGAEMSLSDDLTLKAEYKFFDFGKVSYDINGGKAKADISLNTFVVGINKRF
ncbi:MAG: outer membrane beta-barrel protein [Proteobacteria bacterium]|nr:outer membrane beta-barrel protein [Pseudomonadota bacterium]